MECDCNYLTARGKIIHSVRCNKSELSKYSQRLGFANTTLPDAIFEESLRQDILNEKISHLEKENAELKARLAHVESEYAKEREVTEFYGDIKN